MFSDSLAYMILQFLLFAYSGLAENGKAFPPSRVKWTSIKHKVILTICCFTEILAAISAYL